MIDIFCTKDSLEFIFDEYCRLRSPDRIFDEDDSDYRTAKGFYELILSKANLVTSFSKTELEQLANSSLFFKTLIKRSVSGGSKIIDQGFHETVLNHQFNDYPRAVFMLDKTETECTILKDKFGLLFLCQSNFLKKSRFLFSSDAIPIGDKANNEVTINTWNEFNRFKHPFNSLIIIDNYFWQNENDVNKVIPLLRALLPNQINDSQTDFHLTLVTMEAESKSEQFNEKQREKIEEKLNKELLFPYLIKTSIIKLKSSLKENHDRNILTNYVWFHSGHSFDYFKEEYGYRTNAVSKNITEKTTTLFINGIAFNSLSFSSTNNWIMDGYDQILVRAQNWANKKYDKTNCNRLLPKHYKPSVNT